MTTASPHPTTDTRPARTAVVLAFASNGSLYASLASRLPDIRAELGLTNGQVGLLLLSVSLGSVGAIPLAGGLVLRWGAARVVRVMSVLSALGLLVGAFGATVVDRAWLAGVALVLFGVATSTWDVAMNVDGAQVERLRRSTLMPQLHAMWSVGSICASLIGIPMAAASVPVLVHVGLVAVVACGMAFVAAGRFLPVGDRPSGGTPRRELISAWLEPRTLLVGVMVLCFAAAEGSANDWLTLAVVDGYRAPHWLGVAGFAVFVACMTAGRFGGGLLIARLGRTPVLWASCVAAAGGILITVFAGHLPVAFVGIVIWGLGAAVGFPVGMSAAADDPARAAARVSVVATLGYVAFLVLPPSLGALGDHVGTLRSLVVVAALMLPAAVTVAYARKPAP